MPSHMQRRTSARRSVSLMLVLMLAGLLFTANAKLANESEGRHPENLAELVQIEDARVEALQRDVDELREEVDQLADQAEDRDIPAPSGVFGDPGVKERVGLASGSTPVSGPGLTVELTDAPPGKYGSEITPDTLVVHQQDLEAVINALWAGGAEAMTLQDQRVLSTTAFRCVGNVLSLHGRVYSPPYRVQAIGDASQLRASLDASPEVQNYRDWVDVVGLGWSVVEQPALELPGGSADLVFARVPEDFLATL